MRKFKFLVAGVILMFFFTASFIVNPEKVDAGDVINDQCLIVSLQGKIDTEKPEKMDNAITITPQDLEISVGACAVWVNWIRGAEISISFKEGKVCKISTDYSTLGFRLTPNLGCYVTDFLKQGETTSLRFMEPGTYKYNIYTQSRTNPLASGNIIVK
ncbi:MAG: hypothetical protein KKC46_21795 [Proteobacteria bacterium]|nr:hypothetical protein [Pseudomonadota bacterium]